MTKKKVMILLMAAVMLAVPTPALAEDSQGGSTLPAAEPSVSEPSAADPTESTDPAGTDESAGAGDSTGDSSETGDDESEPELITNLTAQSNDFEKITLSWDGEYTKYYVYRLEDDEWKKIAEVSGGSFTDKDLYAYIKYYYKVCAIGENGEELAAAETSGMVITSKTARLSMIMIGNSRFDVRTAAKQRLYKYDTVQGSCSYGGYGYFVLYNRNKERIKIAKVNLKTKKVVKVSPVLKSKCHGDTLTFNPKTNRIIACCGKGGRYKIAVINAKTLKQVYTKRFSFRIGGISYNRAKNLYVVKLRDTPTKVAILDKNFKVVKYVKLTEYRSYLLSQGVYTEGDYMYDIQSFKGIYKYNLITVRKLDGKFVGRIVVPSGTTGQLFELESVFHEGSSWYFSFYRSNVKKSGDTDRKNYLYKAVF